MRTVSEVSELSGVTVRALHHYDQIGLLSPTERSEAGYRLYSYPDLSRLQEILIWRALRFPLAEIQAMLDDPAYDRVTALERQRELIAQELDRLAAVGQAIDAAIEAQVNGTQLEETDMFNGFDPRKYEDETRQRWGHTETYRDSATRTATYGENEWAEIRAEADAIVQEFVALLTAGEPATGEAACAVAERHRQHISRWFYDCTPIMHRGLGEMYVADERFTQHYEEQAVGLARYVHDAIVANAEHVTAGKRA